MKPFNWRANVRGFTSVLTMLSFCVLAVSGVVLFFVPPGRVANFSDVRLLGFDKTQWQVLHVSFSLLFVVAAITHMLLNWGALVTYFRNRRTRQFSPGWRWVMPLLICAVVFWGSAAGAWPFSLISQWHREIKDSYDGGQEHGAGGGGRNREQSAQPAGNGTELRVRGGSDSRPIQRRYRGRRGNEIPQGQ